MNQNKNKSKVKAKTIYQITGILGLLILTATLSLYPVAGIMMQNYKQTNLVSDIPGMAKYTDSNLKNPWGIARSSTSPWWVSDNGKGVSTIYNGTGVAFPPGNPLIVTVPALPGMKISSPTGIVFNDGSGFWVKPGKAARFIFVTEDGTISAWNSSVNLHNAILKVNNSKTAIYKGATIAIRDGKKYLYTANFKNGSVDVFDTSFKKVAMPKNSFKDSTIPAGYAPFNVQEIQSKIVVAFAKQDATKHDEVDGPGLGYIDLFYPNGTLFMRFRHGAYNNAPWGVTYAPSNFGQFSNRYIVGNFGDGRIMAFNGTGYFKGYLRNMTGPISIKGLWGLKFGNGANAGLKNSLYFTAGINDEANGLFGMIRAS